MALRYYKTLHWTILLANVALLSDIAMTVSHAVESYDLPPTDSGGDGSALQNLSGFATQSLATQYYERDSTASIELYLEVTLNGAKADLAPFYYHDEQLWATVATLQELGFLLPSDSDSKAQLSLNSLTDVKVNYNAHQQTVSIIAPLSLLNLDTTTRSTRNDKRPPATASPGMLLNYSLYGTQTQNKSKSLSAYTELRAFNASGVISSTALTTANTTNLNKHWNASNVRLDTNWSRSFPDKLITVRAGDILTDALSWTRPTRLGGVQVGSNFGLHPYMSTTPLPSFIGSATLPSAVELYINGLKHYSGKVPAGPFELDTAPSFSGAGTAQLVVTDVLGQSTTLNFSLYDSHRLLQSGLSDWSVELGALRKNYGIRSFDYGHDIAASGTWRYGVNNRFTAETHAEITQGVSNFGMGGTFLLGDAGGILFASLAGSKSQGDRGLQYSTNYSWNNRRFHLGLNATGTHGDYRDIGTQYSYAPMRRSEQISTSYSTAALGSFGIGYYQIAQEKLPTTRFATAYWRQSFGKRFILNAALNQDINNAANSSLSIGASLSFDRNISANSNVQHTNTQNTWVTDISQAASSAGGIGWRAQTRSSINNTHTADSRSTDGLAELKYRGRYGQLQAGIATNNDSYSTYGSGTGALVMMGGGVFAARQINDGFAVVSTDGMAHVPVLLQNNAIGTTNNRGLLLISPLNAYQDNKIAIDPMNLPADLRIDKVSVAATPTDRAGVLVNFGITPARSASLILMDHNQQPLALGSKVWLSTKKSLPAAIVGFDGEVYLETLDEHNTLEVQLPAGESCQVSFDYHKQGDGIPLIGPLVCQ